MHRYTLTHWWNILPHPTSISKFTTTPKPSTWTMVSTQMATPTLKIANHAPDNQQWWSTAQQTDPAPLIHTAIPTFKSLASNYLDMLAQKPTDNTMTTDNNHTVSPADIFAPSKQTRQEHMQDYANFLKPGTSLISLDIHMPELTPSPNFGWAPGDEFLSTPAYTPYKDFLTMPVMGEDGDIFTKFTEAALYPANLPLFPDMPSYLMEPIFFLGLFLFPVMSGSYDFTDNSHP